MKIKRTERGWAGHFCCGIKCQWHRNTLIEDEETGRGFVISSVGQMPDELNPKRYAEIGAFRYYETMVFVAKPSFPYIEADVTRQVFLEGIPWSVKEYPKGNVDLLAEDVHEKNVNYVIAKFDELYKTA